MDLKSKNDVIPKEHIDNKEKQNTKNSIERTHTKQEIDEDRDHK